MVFPPEENTGIIKKGHVEFSCQQDVKDFCAINHLNIWKDDDILQYNDLEDGGTYMTDGPYYQALTNEKAFRQMDAVVTEQEILKSVKLYAGDNAHIHSNYKFKVGKQTHEINGIVHVPEGEGGGNVPKSSVYIIEAQTIPPRQG